MRAFRGWWLAMVAGLALACMGAPAAPAQDAPMLETYDNLVKKGFQIAGITPDGRGGQVYHMQKPGAPLYVCRATVLVQGIAPIMDRYCDRVLP